MKTKNIETSVTLIFFNRPETLKKVFEKVKLVKPSKLFLIQDGARDGKLEDLAKINECREIVSEITWECEVYKNYESTNLGCGIKPSSGISWVFEHVEDTIILEDDCVPSISFFYFCDLMLTKYRDDLRVGIISGFNYFEKYDFGGYDYGFVKSGAIWGWATWKNRWEKYDYNIEFSDNEYLIKILKNEVSISKKYSSKRLMTWSRNLSMKSNKSFWDFQWGYIRHLNSWMSIVPKYNMIKNIGFGEDATHTNLTFSKLSRKQKKMFYMSTYEIPFPLHEPKFIIPDKLYDKKYYAQIYPNFIVKIYRKLFVIFSKFKKKGGSVH